MSATLPPLVLPIVGDASQLGTVFTQVQTATQNFSNKLGTSLGGVKTSLANLGSSFKGLVAPIVAAAGAYATFTAGLEALNRADELGKASTALGITTEQLQELQVVARQTGGSTDGMNQALREMNRTLSAAKEGEASALGSLAKLGLTMKDLAGLDSSEAFYKIADAMSKMGDTSERIAISQQVFGRGSRDLAETLTVGANGFRKITEEARKYGLIVSDQDNAKLKEANDALEMMKVKMEAVTSGVMVEFSKSLTFISEEFLKMGQNAAGVNPIIWTLARAFEAVTAVVMDLFKTLEAMGMAITGAVAIAGGALAQLAKAIYQAVTVWGQWFWELAKTIGAAFEWIWGVSKLGLNKFIGFFKEQFASLAGTLGEFLTKAGGMMERFGIAGGESISKLGTDAKEWGANLAKSTEEGAEEAKKIIKDASETMGSTLSRLSSVRAADTPEWIQSWEGFFTDLFQSSQDTFNGMESSILNLVSRWVGASEVITKKTPKTVDWAQETAKTVAEMTVAYKAFAAEIAKADAESSKKAAKSDPAAAAKAEYDDKLKALNNFHAAGAASEEEYQESLSRLNRTYSTQRGEFARKNFEDITKETQGFRETSFQDEMDHLAAVAEAENAAYLARLDAITQMHATEEEMDVATDEAAAQHAENKIAITQRQTQLEVQAHQNAAMVAANVMGQAAALMDKNNKAQFYAWKAFATGQAIVNAFLAYGQVLATPMPDAFGTYRIAMANLTLGLGLASAAKIAATPFGGGGGGGSVGGGGGGGGGGSGAESAKQQAQDSSQTSVSVALYGDSFGANQVRGLMSAINEAAGDNVSIKTQGGN